MADVTQVVVVDDDREVLAGGLDDRGDSRPLLVGRDQRQDPVGRLGGHGARL